MAGLSIRQLEIGGMGHHVYDNRRVTRGGVHPGPECVEVILWPIY